MKRKINIQELDSNVYLDYNKFFYKLKSILPFVLNNYGTY